MEIRSTVQRAALAMLAVTLLSGCITIQNGNDADSSPSPTETGPDLSGLTDREAAIALFRDAYPDDLATDAEITGTLRDACSTLDDGMTPSSLQNFLMNAGIEEEYARVVIVTAMEIYCPEHKPN